MRTLLGLTLAALLGGLLLSGPTATSAGVAPMRPSIIVDDGAPIAPACPVIPVYCVGNCSPYDSPYSPPRGSCYQCTYSDPVNCTGRRCIEWTC